MKDVRLSHPRPQQIRKSWRLLDGEWEFKFDDKDVGLKNKWREGLTNTEKILVPFTYETELSGINKEEFHPIVWYQCELEVDELENYLLHFEGSDYFTQVWLNGEKIGENYGGYHRFSFNLDESVKLYSSNTLIVRVEDSMAGSQPRGKQRWLKDNFGCWYVQTTGIWKSVWLEKVKRFYIESIKLTPLIDSQELICQIELNDFDRALNYQLQAEVKFDGNIIYRGSHSLAQNLHIATLSVEDRSDTSWGLKKWTPETPHLYDLKLTLLVEDEVSDSIDSYFGMRSISIEGSNILLNGHNLYQRLILDQGYWAESGITPPSIEALELDIKRIQEMGYNGVRKHQKIEDERFLYLCDKLGLLVWSEMAATYEFNDRAVESFTKEWLEIVKQQYNHPSIITWVPFNESWGIQQVFNNEKQQNFTESIYYLTKTIDDTRPVVTNDGWEHTISDIITLHDYEENLELFNQRYADKREVVNNKIMFNKDWFAFADGYTYQGQPIIISEFGGIAFKDETGWGYGNQVESKEVFLSRFNGIHQAIQDLDYVSGFCYTQLTDVEQEVNGLLFTNREPKVDLDVVKKINERRQK